MNEKLIELALSCGATHAAVIDTADVALSASFYDICASNACGNFGKCWVCPPDCGPVEESMARVRSYPKGLLYQYIGTLEDSFDIEGMGEAAVHHAQIGQKLLDATRDLIPDSWHLSCGGCHLCERCAKRDNEPCRHPDRALVAMEACGIDVSATTKHTDMKYINGADTVTYFGLILFREG